MTDRDGRDDRDDRDGRYDWDSSDSDEASPNEADPDGATPDEVDPRIDALADDETPEASLEDDPFETMDVDVGETDVWAALETDDPDALDREPETVTASEVAGDSETTPDAGESGEADWADDAGYDDRIVDKREYCQRCPYSTDPPTLACTHDGTEIVEVVEMGRFRVRNCPMVSADGPTFDRVNE